MHIISSPGFVGVAVFAAISSTVGAFVNVADAQMSGLSIAKEADARREGFGSYSVRMDMILRSPSGSENRRELRTRTLETDNGDQRLIIFDAPKDVAGTALLTHGDAAGPDIQWLYLPALKRIKRISSANQSGAFMGSEFTYEDLSSQDVDKYRGYTLLAAESLDGTNAWKLERRPANDKSGYTRQLVWFDQQEYRPLKIEFYDQANDLLKTLTITDYRLYLGRYWHPSQMKMHNHQTGKTTILRWHAYDFDSRFSKRDFDPDTLDRIR